MFCFGLSTLFAIGAERDMMISMKYVRYSIQGNVRYGILDGKTIHELSGSYFEPYTETGKRVSLDSVKLLSPTLFSKAVCIGMNYRDHAMEFKLPIPESPVLFLKPSTAVNDPDGMIHYPELSTHLDYEGELAVIIGKKCKDVSEKEYASYVLGYSCANDVTARDLQPKQGQWTIAKGFDTFCPVGPYIETDIDPSHLALETKVNGETKQKSNTSNLIFPVPYLVSYISHIMTLLPGDIISTGTPSGISKLDHGDTVEVCIEGLGVLRNKVD